MDEASISWAMTAEELQHRWPGTTAVLLRRRMACVGCPMARFDTIRDLAANYGVSMQELLEELTRAAQAPAGESDPPAIPGPDS